MQVVALDKAESSMVFICLVSKRRTGGGSLFVLRGTATVFF
jgi:hypothetical protein